jgi:hypothetical protein
VFCGAPMAAFFMVITIGITGSWDRVRWGKRSNETSG